MKVKIIEREIAFKGKYLQFVKKHFRTSLGGEGVWETVERKNTHGEGAVVIIPLTKERDLILERNWRVPLESFIVQFPAGLTDREGEKEEDTARRELLEETGYAAKRLIPIISVPLAPALTPTRAIHFFAPDVEFVGGKSEDVAEEIEVLKVPFEKAGDFLLRLPGDTKLDLRVPGILWILERRGLI